MENENCVFCKIIKGIEPCHKIWEDDEFIAFLSIFPNTKGYSIVATKTHYPSYCFNLPDKVLSKLIVASKIVAKRIDERLDDVGRTGLILEGFGVNHAHSKLFPMHGTKEIVKNFEPMTAHKDKYTLHKNRNIYIRANDKDLEKLAKKLIRD